MKTLVVEDDFISRLLLQRILASYGECHIAVNGQEAVVAFERAMAAGECYDLICLDIMMPELDGQEALKRIRAVESAANVPPGGGVKIIITTALGDPKSVISAFYELCDAYMVKPIDRSTLIGHIRAFGLLR